MMHTLSYSEIKRYANGYWLEIFEDLAPELGPAIQISPNHATCPVHDGTDGFRFFKDFEENGGGTSPDWGLFYDYYKILDWANSWSHWESLCHIVHYLGWHKRFEDRACGK